MTEQISQVEKDRQRITSAREKGALAKILTYAGMSGPGWLQGAITLGGGSLAGSLYLASVGGFEMMWLQPLMMIFGIVMLSAIAYVALSTGKSPFHEINKHVNPVLGWGWAIATLMANLVWAMPQFSLGTAAMQQNLGIVPDTETGKYLGVGILFVIAIIIIWFYDSGSWGIKLFEILLKVMVGIIVISFFLVVIAMSTGEAGLDWGGVISGFVPNPNLLFEPVSSLRDAVANSSAPELWKEVIVSAQRDRMVAAAATAVGINMTFLLPYSMLKRKWNRDFRGLATFDLSIGLFIPFLLATSCVMIAAGNQFHAKADPALIGEAERTKDTVKLEGGYKANLDKVLATLKTEDEIKALKTGQEAHDAKVKEKLTSLKAEIAANTSKEDHEKNVAAQALQDPNLGLGFGPLDQARDALKLEDKTLASTLIKRDSFALANSLEELAGKGVAQSVFGIGVVGMALSTIIILMLINGFTICEMLNQPSSGWLHRIGCFIPAITGLLGFLFLWGDDEARFYLAVPTSRFGMILLPIAYLTFFFMMNNRKILGDELPKGGKRIGVNLLMLVALALAITGAAVSILNEKAKLPGTDIEVKYIAYGVIGAFFALALIVHIIRIALGGNSQRSADG